MFRFSLDTLLSLSYSPRTCFLRDFILTTRVEVGGDVISLAKIKSAEKNKH